MTHPCPDCLTSRDLAPDQIGRLRSRDYGLRRIEALAYSEIGAPKPAEPKNWLDKVATSIIIDGFLQPILITAGSDGLELIDGNHRAWVAHTCGISAPVLIFIPDCGSCTESMLRSTAMSQTQALGWTY